MMTTRDSARALCYEGLYVWTATTVQGGTMADLAAGQSRQGAFDRLIAAVAVVGGFLSLGLALMVVISVSGRALISKPIEGDFELVKMATAVSVFAFLPYTQLRRGNIMVDTFTSWLPTGVHVAMDAFWDIVYALMLGLLTYCFVLGTRDYIRSGETMMMHPILLWPAIAMCTALCALTALSTLVSMTRMLRGRS